ncbi:hypothetical protein OUZ56_010069 [Daphnia magna]|uniref:Uncharacterized protein n=1 Tax=Daphnia magna TaxID=35525 RepID=A0ABR0AHQ0_9CRUS|nr:hypothetical protein OUZ56_010069 [Daphnia magna]
MDFRLDNSDWTKQIGMARFFLASALPLCCNQRQQDTLRNSWNNSEEPAALLLPAEQTGGSTPGIFLWPYSAPGQVRFWLCLPRDPASAHARSRSEHSPNGISRICYRPSSVTKAVFGFAASATGTCQYPL